MPHAARCKDVLNFIQKITVRPPVDKKVAGIIYCRRKDTCTELAQYLRQYGVMASPFHRGLSDTVNNMNQLAWVDGDSFGSDGTLVRCIVATVAFGMGIDKVCVYFLSWASSRLIVMTPIQADCSYVVHFDTPSTFEGYYQETGRAGRNGHPARCLMYYSVEDETRISSLVQRSHNRSKDKKQAAHGGGSATKWNPMTSLMALIAFARNARVCRHVEICELLSLLDLSKQSERLIRSLHLRPILWGRLHSRRCGQSLQQNVRRVQTPRSNAQRTTGGSAQS